MNNQFKPYIQTAINEVNAVVFDPQGHQDADRCDRYPTFEEARDAALSCVELMLDEADYDGDDHRTELESMRAMLDAAVSYDDLAARPEYRWFLAQLEVNVLAVA